MRKQDARKLYRELVRRTTKELNQYFEDAWRSGGFNPSDLMFGDPDELPNYTLPKVILVAALKEYADQYRLFDKGLTKISENVRLTTYSST